VNALRRFKEDEINDRLIGDGDVVARPIPLDVPKRLVSHDKHGSMRHEAMLIVRRDSEEELDDLSSHLAVYRGREMVISYISLKHAIPGSAPFRAILLCGEAAGSSDADRSAERFLRTAEPPAHNEWKSTPELKAEYAWGANARIKSMLDEAKRVIRDLVRPGQPDLDDGPRELKELLKLSGPPEKHLFPRISRQEGTIILNESNAKVWSVQVGVRPPDSKPWRIQPVLKFAVESGGDRPVPWTIEAVERCTVTADGWVNIPEGMREAVFRGKSEPSGHPVTPNEAAVTVSIRSAERRQGGSR
jgi:RNA polymerase primary sigma factor